MDYKLSREVVMVVSVMASEGCSGVLWSSTLMRQQQSLLA